MLEKISKIFFSFVLLGVLLVQPAMAAEFVRPDKSGNATVSGAQHRNVYSAGGNVTVTSNVAGDLVIAGGNALVQGKVEQDLMAAGGTVVVSGEVGSNLRIGGGNITITAPVLGDVLIGGGNVTLASTARVSGDLVIGAGNVVVDGPVSGTVRIAGGTVRINSEIGGEVFVRANKSLVFGPLSRVSGKIEYRGQSEAITEDGAQVSTINFTHFARREFKFHYPFFFGGRVIWAIGIIVAGLLLLKFLPKRTGIVVEKAFDKPWTNLGVGFVFAIVLPISAAICFITIAGFYVGLVLLSWLVLFALLVSILEAMVVGVILLKWLKKYDRLSWQALLTGAVVLMILSFIPILGALLCAVVWLIVFGATLRLVKSRIAAERA